MSYILITPKPTPVLVRPLRFILSSKVVLSLFEQGKIKEEDYKKYLLSKDPYYLPSLIKQI